MVKAAAPKATKNNASKPSAPRSTTPPSGKLKPAPAPRPRRGSRTIGKRSFRQFSAKSTFKPAANQAYRIDHSPFQLSMKAVKLKRLEQAYGMDGIRKATQRNLLWYWQWSRDWGWSYATSAAKTPPHSPGREANSDTPPQQHQALDASSNDASEHQHTAQQGVWYWRWREKHKKMAKALRSKLPMRFCKEVAINVINR